MNQIETDQILLIRRDIQLVKKNFREAIRELDIRIGKIEADVEQINKWFAQIDITSKYED